MNYDRVSIKEKAKAALRANYWPMVGISIAFPLALGLLGQIPLVGFLISIAITPIVSISYQYMCYRVYIGAEQPSFEALLNGFKDGKYGKLLGGYWLVVLFTFLWSLLLYIPGIIKAISYSMTSYILMENPDMPVMDAIEKSKEMTNGHKMDIFVTYLSFIGWGILSAFTFGILAVFYVGPYMNLTMAGIYDTLKGGSSISVESVEVTSSDIF